ncbi:MAG: DNA repair protein RecO [Armatimonadota bacterium]|nr:MAG: DNA repair protein RecO [Armatimonadota bacterium]
MPPVNVQAIVLRRRSLGEADKVLTLFTREMGKLSAIAKGSRKPTSKLAGATETCVRARFHLAQGKTFWIVTQASVERARARLHRLLVNATAALYACELVDCLLEEGVPEEDLFDLLSGTLDELESSERPMWTLCLLENAILLQQGYTPVLDTCARCGKPVDAEQIAFLPGAGGVLCAACVRAENNVVNLSRLAWLTWRVLNASGQVDFPGEPTATELEYAVHLHLRYHLDREMRSTQVLWQLRQEL